MRKSLFITLFLFLALSFSLSVRNALAQTEGSSGFDGNQSTVGQLNINVSPSAPGPLINVTLMATNFAQDLTKSDITWSVNGVQKERGVGRSSFTFTNGPIGSVTRVHFRAVTLSGDRVEKDLTFRPASVEILWEADSYTPETYAGKALASSEAGVKFIALPYFIDNGTRLPAANLYYQWQVNFEPASGLSGIGKNVFSTRGPNIFGESTLTLRVSTLDGRIIAKGAVVLRAFPPETLFYVEDPLAGPNYAHPIFKNFNLTDAEVTIRGEAFFLARSHKPLYRWSLSGKSATADEQNPKLLTLRQGSESGSANINLSVSDPFNALVTSARSIIIKFNGVGGI